MISMTSLLFLLHGWLITHTLAHSVCSQVQSFANGTVVVQLTAAFSARITSWRVDLQTTGLDPVYVRDVSRDANTSLLSGQTNAFSIAMSFIGSAESVTIYVQGTPMQNRPVNALATASVVSNGAVTPVSCQPAWNAPLTVSIANISFSQQIDAAYSANTTASSLLLDSSLDTCFEYSKRTSQKPRTSIRLGLASPNGNTIGLNITGNAAFNCAGAVVYETAASQGNICDFPGHRECQLVLQTQKLITTIFNGVPLYSKKAICTFNCSCKNCTYLFIDYLNFNVVDEPVGYPQTVTSMAASICDISI